MRMHHIGIAGKDIASLRKWVSYMHCIEEEGLEVFDPLQQASLMMLRTSTGLQIELIAGGQVASIVKRGNNFYHICYEVSVIEDSLNELIALGAMVISPPQPAVLFNERKVAFLYTPMGIIELLEEKK